MKTFFLSSIFACIIFTAGAQEKVPTNVNPTGLATVRTPENAVNLNLFSFGLSTAAVRYERGWHKNFSAALSLSYTYGIRPPSMITSFVEGDEVIQDIKQVKITGYSITPEFRIYPGKKEKNQAPHGFYFSIYGRYCTYGSDQKVRWENIEANGTKTEEEAVMRLSFTGMGGGLGFGYHWIISDMISLDWYILGGHYGKTTISGEGTAVSIGKDPDGFIEDVESFGLGDYYPTATTSGNTGKISMPQFPFAGIRSGLSIGIAF